MASERVRVTGEERVRIGKKVQRSENSDLVDSWMVDRDGRLERKSRRAHFTRRGKKICFLEKERDSRNQTVSKITFGNRF